MGKLVRDKIPAIIEADGKTSVTRILDNEMYEMELYIKLTEEMQEFLNAVTKTDAIEELADLIEVIHALAKSHGASVEELERVRKKKLEERGAFDDKIFLIKVK